MAAPTTLASCRAHSLAHGHATRFLFSNCKKPYGPELEVHTAFLPTSRIEPRLRRSRFFVHCPMQSSFTAKGLPVLIPKAKAKSNKLNHTHSRTTNAVLQSEPRTLNRRRSIKRGVSVTALWKAQESASKQTGADAKGVVESVAKNAKETGSVLGAIALITGSTVGAGMLALPAATAGGGFVPSAGVMTLSWCLLTLESLLIAEVNLALMNKRKKQGEDTSTVVSLRQMAEETLGEGGGRLASVVYLFLSYTLLVAYVSKGGEIVNLLSGDMVPKAVGGSLFAAALGGLLGFGSTKTVDHTNQALTLGLLVLFGGLLFGGSQLAQWDTLLVQQDWSQAWGALPIVFLSLVFHDLVPVLCKYLGGDKAKIHTSLVVGGVIPLVMFLAWDAVALAMVPGAAEVAKAGGIIDPLRVLIETQGSLASTCLGMFSLLAIVTSFIGTTLGLSEYMLSEVKEWQKQGQMGEHAGQSATQEESMDHGACKNLAISLAVVPPVIASSLNPNLFFVATQIAGAYGMTLLYGIMPPIMAWCMRHPPESQTRRVKFPMVPGGRPVLASLASCAAAIELGKFAMDSGTFFSELAAVGTRIESAANLVISDLASAEGFTQAGNVLNNIHLQ